MELKFLFKILPTPGNVISLLTCALGSGRVGASRCCGGRAAEKPLEVPGGICRPNCDGGGGSRKGGRKGTGGGEMGEVSGCGGGCSCAFAAGLGTRGGGGRSSEAAVERLAGKSPSRESMERGRANKKDAARQPL